MSKQTQTVGEKSPENQIVDKDVRLLFIFSKIPICKYRGWSFNFACNL